MLQHCLRWNKFRWSTISVVHKSAWAKDADFQGNVEEIFINCDVQNLLRLITGLDLRKKIFAERKIRAPQRPHFALMNDEMFQEVLRKMEHRGKGFLQFVPVKEPRPKSFEVLAEDKEIYDFDTAKFVFTDITFDATNQNRTVVVREVDGTLRTAFPEEHDRMNRLFYEQPDRPVNEPPAFSHPHLTNALDKNMHEFLLDWACYYFEPDDPRYVEVCQSIYDRVAEKNEFEQLYSTRHFGPLVFYLIINDNIAGLESFLKTLKCADNEMDTIVSFNKLKDTVLKLCNK